MEKLLLFLGWTAWCGLHSLLISPWATSWLNRQGGWIKGAYRLVYSVFSAASLIPLVWYQCSLPQQVVFSWSGPWLRVVQGLLLLYALIMLVGGIKVYDLGYLVGISQWRNYYQGKTAPPLPFACQGMLQYVRHPWYSSGLPILWTIGPITDASLPSRIVLSLYLVIGTLLEERKLVRELGNQYRQYQQQVPMLIPWKGRVTVQIAAQHDRGGPGIPPRC